MDLAFWVIYQSIVHGFCSNMGYFKALRKLLLEWQSVTVTLLPIPEGVTLTADHCILFTFVTSKMPKYRNIGRNWPDIQKLTIPIRCFWFRGYCWLKNLIPFDSWINSLSDSFWLLFLRSKGKDSYQMISF